VKIAESSHYLEVNMDIVEIPEFAQIEKKAIAYDPNLIVQYRFNGNDGMFYCGDRTFETLEMRPFYIRSSLEERWGRARQLWMDIAFLDDDNDICMISLKKDAITEISIGLAELERAGVNYQAVRMILHSEPRQVDVVDAFNRKKREHFFSVGIFDHHFVTEAQFNDLQEFLTSINGRFRWNLLGEVGNAYA
jgi:hypothetical protein